MRQRVLLSVGNKELSLIIRNALKEHPDRFLVVEKEIFHQDFILDITEEEQPDILLLHDYYLSSNKETTEEREKSWLSIFSRLRETYDNDIRFVFLCERETQDPFLSELVSRNVLDIFNSNAIDKQQLVDQLLEKPRYSNVSKFVDRKDMKTRNVRLSQEELIEELSDEEDTDTGSIEHVNDKPTKQVSKEAFSVINEDEFNVPIKEKVIIQERLIGAIFIGVAGVESATGSTHLSLLLANFLSKKGLRVAVLEANKSEDFFEIEYAYEGGRGYTSEESKFVIEGITHYKSVKGMNIADIVHLYDFIILDIGSIEKTVFFEEFYRSHISIVTAHGSEWRRKSLLKFLQKHHEKEHQSWKIVVPFADSLTLHDLKKETGLSIYSLPSHPDPYQGQADTDHLLEEMLQGYIPKKKRQVATSSKWIYAGVAVLVISLITSSLFFFR
ncbi:hypothetical protein ACFSCX_06570 [Bacillus salitolerans]|uniref:Uncharacterized protein n=1 Tax=Bacillus salitolerans TaxID=1437434 RepID=A0ABW4LNX6_9BACI